VSKVIYIPELRKNLIFFEKSGSSLMAGFFKSILDWKAIPIIGSRYEGAKTLLFVRNPMERLVSIFYHLGIARGMEIPFADKIRALDRFLDGYKDKCAKSKDSHLQPQSWDLDRVGNETIYKIEDIREGWDRLVDRYRPSSNISFSTTKPFFTAEEYIKDFGILDEVGIPMDTNDRMYSVTLYGFILNKLNEGHHHNESHLMLHTLYEQGRRDIIGKLKDITKEEMDTFGYTNKELI
jgi:hypothetical protein